MRSVVRDESLYRLLAQRVSYDPETGVFTWLMTKGETRKERFLNTKFGGKRAGTSSTDGYRSITFQLHGRPQSLREHRLAWFIHFGRLPEADIDHINGNPSDNRIANLRDVPRTINSRNQKRRSDSPSGVTGVRKRRDRPSWRGLVVVDGRTLYVGSFSDKAQAEAAVREFRSKHGFTDRHGSSGKENEIGL